MGVKISGRYTGKLGTEMLHTDSGAAIRTAAPKDNMGNGDAFSPTDLCVAALGSCVLTTMAIVAERDDIDIEGAHFIAEKHMALEPRRIEQINLALHLPASISGVHQRKLMAAAKACPVKHSLSSDINIAMTFHYDVSAD